MPNMSAQALRTAVIQAAVSDTTFRNELGSNALKAIEGRFGKQSHKIDVVFEKADQLPLIIPFKTEQLSRSLERAVKDVGNRKPTRGQFEAILIQRAWNDSTFLNALTTESRATFSAELKKYDSSLPENKGVQVYVEGPEQCVIVVPSAAVLEANEELTETELEAVAGGEGIVCIAVVTVVGGVVATTTGVIVNEWVCS